MPIVKCGKFHVQDQFFPISRVRSGSLT